MADWFYRWRWVPWLLVLFTLMAGGFNALVAPTPPLEFHGSVAHPSIVRVGELANISYTSTRNRVCKAEISMGWVDNLKGVVMRLEPTAGGVGRVGNYTQIIQVPVPDKPGRYCFRLVGQHHCDSDDFTVEAPEACLNVVP